MNKSFDQQKMLLDKEEFLKESKTTPNKAIKSYVVLEPIEHQGVTRVRVTARDENLDVLWGVMISEGLMPSGNSTPVAIYSSLRNMIREKLSDPKPKHEITSDPYESISHCKAAINELIDESLKRTVQIKKKNAITNTRADDVASILWDTLQQLSYSLDKLGIKSSSSTGSEK